MLGLPVGNLHRLPVFKNNGKRSDDLGKYWPGSLLPIISEIFESFIKDSFTKHLDILAFSLTFSMVFVLSSPLLTSWLFSMSVFTIRWMLAERRGLLHLISKRHSIRFGMLHKLKAYGVVGPILSILDSFLQEHSLKVVLDGHSSPLISPMLESLKDQFWGQHYSWFLLMTFPIRFHQE